MKNFFQLAWLGVKMLNQKYSERYRASERYFENIIPEVSCFLEYLELKFVILEQVKIWEKTTILKDSNEA